MKEVIYNAQTGEVTERELTAEEVAQMEMEQPEEIAPQPTLEQRVEAVEEVTAEVITILNDKGIAP